MLPNIREDELNVIGFTQGSMSYASCTNLLNDFLPRSRQPLKDDLQCSRFINGLAKFQLPTQAKSHRSQQNGYNMPLVELQNILNYLVTDSPHMGRATSAPAPSNNP
jgi:hypothetical protein